MYPRTIPRPAIRPYWVVERLKHEGHCIRTLYTTTSEILKCKKRKIHVLCTGSFEEYVSDSLEFIEASDE